LNAGSSILDMARSKLDITRSNSDFNWNGHKVVQVDAANDLALLKADGRFACLPIAASRTVNLGGTWRRSVFPTSVCRGY
jgi:S1-C subfamily serine protease